MSCSTFQQEGFQLIIIEYYIGSGFVINGFLLHWDMFPHIHFHNSFIMNGCWILSSAFSVSVEVIIQFFSFHLLRLCITLIICICWPNLVMLEWIQLGCGVWPFSCAANILLRIFTSIFNKDFGLKFSFFMVLCLILVSGWWWVHRMSLGVFFLLQSFGGVWEGSI